MAVTPVRLIDSTKGAEEKLVGKNSPTLPDVLNRPLQDVLSGSGYKTDGTDFAGFAPTLANAATATDANASATDYVVALLAGVTRRLGLASLAKWLNARRGEYHVVDYGAKGDGVADDRGAIAAADAAAAASGGTTFLPAGTYRVATSFAFTAPVVAEAGARFAPDAGADVSVSSTYQSIESRGVEVDVPMLTQGATATYANVMIRPPLAGGGASNRRHYGLAVEMDLRGDTRTSITPANSNDRCALYAATVANDGGSPFAANFLINLNTGYASAHPGICLELDVNTSVAGKGNGLWINGGGPANPGNAISIYRADTTEWAEGIHIEGAKYPLHVVPPADMLCGLYFDGGASASASGSGWIKIKPLDDLTPTAPAILIANAADNAVRFEVTKQGDVKGLTFQFMGKSQVQSPLDGQITLMNAAGTDFTLLQLGGNTSAFPALKRNGNSLKARLADDSNDASMLAFNIVATGAAGNNGAGTVAIGGTTATTVGAAGTAGALPAQPLGYLIINVAGTQAKIPYYNA